MNQQSTAPPPSPSLSPSAAPVGRTLLSRPSDGGVRQWFSSLLAAFIDMVDPVLMRLSRNRRLVVVEQADGSFVFHKASGSKTTLIETGTTGTDAVQTLQAWRNAEVDLRLAAENVMTATIQIPAAGLDYAEQIVESRLDRLTPWRPETVLYGFAVAATPGPDGQRAVSVAATSRQIAEASMARLDAFGLAPSTLGSSAAPLGSRPSIDLFRGSRDNGRKARHRRIGIYTIGVFALALGFYLASLYYVLDSGRQIADLDATLAKARSRLIDASSSSAGRQKDFALMDAKVADRARFVLIARLATIIPDSAYLDELDLRDGSLRMAGTSTDAAGLIKLIEADPAFSDAAFAAPVTRQDDGRDRFDLSARIVAEPQEAAP